LRWTLVGGGEKPVGAPSRSCMVYVLVGKKKSSWSDKYLSPSPSNHHSPARPFSPSGLALASRHPPALGAGGAVQRVETVRGEGGGEKRSHRAYDVGHMGHLVTAFTQERTAVDGRMTWGRGQGKQREKWAGRSVGPLGH